RPANFAFWSPCPARLQRTPTRSPLRSSIAIPARRRARPTTSLRREPQEPEMFPVTREFRLTGRIVFVCLVLFFATIAAVNAIMIRAATVTFGGVETANAYQAGLAFNRAHAAAVAQDGRHWNVAANLTRGADGTATLVVSLHDGAGKPVSG